MLRQNALPLVLIGCIAVFAVLWLWRRCSRSRTRYAGMAVIPVRLWSGVLINDEAVMGASLVVDTGSSVMILMRRNREGDCSAREGVDKTYNYGTARFSGRMVQGKLPLRKGWVVQSPWLCPTSGSDSVGVWGLCNNNNSTKETSFIEAMGAGSDSLTLGVNFRDMWVSFRPAQSFTQSKVKDAHLLSTINPSGNSVNRPYVPLTKLTVGGYVIKTKNGAPIPAIFDTGTSYPLVFVPPRPRGISISTALTLAAVDWTFTVGSKRYRTHCPSTTSANPAVGSHGLEYSITGKEVTLGDGSFVIIGCPALLCFCDVMNVHMRRSSGGLLQVTGYEFINLE